MKALPLLAGLIGGLVGAAVWAAIAYFTQRELAIIAWGIGGLVGFCVGAAARSDAGAKYGMAAAIFACLAVVGGKYAAVYATASQIEKKIHSEVAISDDELKIQIADEVVQDKVDANARLTWPEGQTVETADAPEDYPKEVWAEAVKRWDAMPEPERTQRRSALEAQSHEFVAAVMGGVTKEAFWSTFGLFDILFFLLAIITAFRLGSGGLGS